METADLGADLSGTACLQEFQFSEEKCKTEEDTIVTVEHVVEVSAVGHLQSVAEEFHGGHTLQEILKATKTLKQFAAHQQLSIPGHSAVSSIDDIVGSIVASGLFGASPEQPHHAPDPSAAGSDLSAARRLLDMPARRGARQQLAKSREGLV